MNSTLINDELIRLRALVNAFGQLESSLDMDEVLQSTLKTATKLMNADIGSIALINEERTHLIFIQSTDKKFDELKNLPIPLGEGITGNVALSGIPARVDDVHKDNRHYGAIDEKLGYRTNSYLCVPLIANETIIGTAQIMNRSGDRGFNQADEKLMQGFARQAALAIQKARMHQVLLKQKVIESELKLCATIQQKIFPDASPAIPDFDILGSSVPSREVGGDYFSFIKRSDNSSDILIADVSGKGLAAALMVSELHTGIHLLSQFKHSLLDSIRILNEHLIESLILGKFISLFAFRINPNQNRMTYVLAGHPAPLIINREGGIKHLTRTGPVLGIPGAGSIHDRNFSMKSGDLLIAFTDGYSEAQNDAGELFDESKIGEAVSEMRDLPLQEVQNRLDDTIRVFTRNRPPPDDASLLLIRRL